ARPPAQRPRPRHPKNMNKEKNKIPPPKFADPANDNEMTNEQWLAFRKEAALQIDPETAKVHWAIRADTRPLRRQARPPEGMPMCRPGVFCPCSRKRHVGVVW